MLRPFSSIGSTATVPATTNGTAAPIINNLHRRLDYGNDIDTELNGCAFLEESSSLGATGDTSDSKDSQNIKEDLPKEWFYDEYTNEMDCLEEPKSPVDDEYDYDPRYGNKKRRKRGRVGNPKMPRTPHHPHSDSPVRKGRPPGTGGGQVGGARRGRRKAGSQPKKGNLLNDESFIFMQCPLTIVFLVTDLFGDKEKSTGKSITSKSTITR